MTQGLTNWANELTKVGYAPKLIGYVDTVVADLTNPPAPETLLWDGGSLPGLTRLTETDDMGSPAWLKQQGLPIEDNANGWNGYSGTHHWQQRTVQPVDANCTTPQAKRAAYTMDQTDTAILTNRAIEYVQEQKNKQPFALHLSLLKPHPPWIATEPFVDMYTPKECNANINKIRATRQEEQTLHPWLSAVHGVKAETTKQSNSVLDMSDAMLDSLKATYYALITELDYHLGRLFTALKESKQWDDTLIVSRAE